MAHNATILELPIELSSLAVTVTLGMKLTAKPNTSRHCYVQVFSYLL